MRITELVWDDETIEHLARHGVEPQEAEEACRIRPYPLRARGGRSIILGQTRAGRYLTVILEFLEHRCAQVITARTMTDAERRRYLRR